MSKIKTGLLSALLAFLLSVGLGYVYCFIKMAEETKRMERSLGLLYQDCLSYCNNNGYPPATEKELLQSASVHQRMFEKGKLKYYQLPDNCWLLISTSFWTEMKGIQRIRKHGRYYILSIYCDTTWEREELPIKQ